MNEGSAKQQIVEGIKANSNILVTVSDSPSVDELSAALGLTLLLNKLDKRATSIFSGKVPPAITFLDPEKTFEGTVDSLRDFIIALDKEKADHLRYKVDGDVVKIFITPYRTTLTDKDLEFSQGDYNVEMVIALGVKEQDHLDKALAAHGRILHDAVVATVTAGAEPSKMGSIDWRDAMASSLCEMLVSLSEALKDDTAPLLDETIATAFLTGIVSATDRFSNERTSSRVMTMAAQLMAAGANQQLIAAKLQEAHDIGPSANRDADGTPPPPSGDTSSDTTPKDTKSKKDKKKKDDNSLQIDRGSKKDDKKPDTSKDAAPKDDVPAVAPPVELTSQDDQPSEASDTPPAEEAAVEAALDQAEPTKDVEQELAEKLAEVAPSVPAPAPSTEALQQELNETLHIQPQFDMPAPEIAEVPAPAPEPAPSVEPTLAVESDGMPGFEALDVPAPAAPETTVSDAIQARSGSDYVAPTVPPEFDTSAGSIIEGSDSAADSYVDPFQTPLQPLPDLHDSKNIAPVDAGIQTPPTNVVSDDAAAPTLEQIEKIAMPPLPPTDIPTSSLPDMTDTSLPPLPPPPPPPVFDQPGIPSAGAVSIDKLGDIFGDAPAQPEAPVIPTEPPKPGQFQIPKM